MMKKKSWINGKRNYYNKLNLEKDLSDATDKKDGKISHLKK